MISGEDIKRAAGDVRAVGEERGGPVLFLLERPGLDMTHVAAALRRAVAPQPEAVNFAAFGLLIGERLVAGPLDLTSERLDRAIDACPADEAPYTWRESARIDVQGALYEASLIALEDGVVRIGIDPFTAGLWLLRGVRLALRITSEISEFEGR